MIKSLLVAKDDDPIIQKVLHDMMAAGKITIRDKDAVQHSLSSSSKRISPDI